MRTTVRVLGSGKVTIPAQVRDALGLEQGDLVEVDVLGLPETTVGGNETVVA